MALKVRYLTLCELSNVLEESNTFSLHVMIEYFINDGNKKKNTIIKVDHLVYFFSILYSVFCMYNPVLCQNARRW